MTELQILRNSLFDEISRIKRGTADIQDSHTIVKLANTVISTYNTELKAIDLLNRTAESNATEVKIFHDDLEKKMIDYVADDK
jgi:hypothetical protein